MSGVGRGRRRIARSILTMLATRQRTSAAITGAVVSKYPGRINDIWPTLSDLRALQFIEAHERTRGDVVKRREMVWRITDNGRRALASKEGV